MEGTTEIVEEGSVCEEAIVEITDTAVVAVHVVKEVVDNTNAPAAELLMTGIGDCVAGTGGDIAVLVPVVGGRGTGLYLCVLWQLVLWNH